MAFPLPLDPEFRKEAVRSWITDVEDRLELGDLSGADQSWRTANFIYLGLPPGSGEDTIEAALDAARVKLREYHSMKTK